MESKKNLSESDIKEKFITPALLRAGWNEELQIRREVKLTDGMVQVKGKDFTRAEYKRADYVLYYKPNIPIAIIEAKDNTHSVRSGIQQALAYRELLEDVPCVYSSNGDAFFECDYTASDGLLEKEIPLNEFPSPEVLWSRYKKFKNITDDNEIKIVEQDYYYITDKQPRYYQQVAINRIVEAIAKGQKRILLVLATGTGKTLVAFQIIYRLWKSKKAGRILFLADRNALISQTATGDFKPFGQAMTIIKKKTINKEFEIFLALYQGLTDYDEDKDAYREFTREFFDLVVIDECHRGSAADDSAWREILDYFNSAVHIGLTATPKETNTVSNIDYFGEPIYTYTLKQGIDDGFLAPYQVLRIGLNVDLEGWRPETGKTDKDGRIVDDREYNIKDYDRNLVIEERTQLVAKKITEYLTNTDRFAKTIIFCVDINHAERMREALRNENQDIVKKNSKYIMQMTGDNEDGKRELENFQNPERKYPTIVTTSKLLSTGVDIPTCKVIVLDANINSMTEFKQIIGRGTRLSEIYDKLYFTIIDFRENARNFANPDFDGSPIQDLHFGQNDVIELPDIDTNEQVEYEFPNSVFQVRESVNDEIGGQIFNEPNIKVFVNGVEVTVLNERVQYYGNDGTLTTESLIDFTRNNFNAKYQSLDNFLSKWRKADKKQAVIEELLAEGILLNELQNIVGKDLDPFDLILHVVYDKPATTRKERADNVKKRNYFGKYQDNARKVLENILDKYATEGIENIESLQVLKLNPLNNFGTPWEIFQFFGSKENYISAVKDLENEIYNQVS